MSGTVLDTKDKLVNTDKNPCPYETEMHRIYIYTHI